MQPSQATGTTQASATSTTGSTNTGITSTISATETATGSPTSTSAPTSTSQSSGESSSTTPGEACSADIDSIWKTIFRNGCTISDCHDAVDPAAGLNLVSPGVEDRLVGIAAQGCADWLLVTAGAPEKSLLYTKVAGPPPCGALMPIRDQALSDEELACIAGWIEGAVPSCETCGGASCINLSYDPEHCGDCGTSCPLGATCNFKNCTCAANETACNNVCVDTNTDLNNCGDCDNICPKDHVCAAGECAISCGDLMACDDLCVDLESNPQHCGSCGKSCAPGTTCTAGNCKCDGDVVSFAADVAPLLADHCSSGECHGAPQIESQLDLSLAKSWTETVNVNSVDCVGRKLVVPFDVDKSHIINKLRGVDTCAGTTMPKEAPPLSEQDIALVTAWICGGALDD